MWVVTDFGFFSVVQKPGDAEAGTLTVRARVRGDLEAVLYDVWHSLHALQHP